MRRAGFIFSLDAFVAFTLIMVTVSLLVFMIGTPRPFYPSLEQAHQLAHDTLETLATSSDKLNNPLKQTYLEQILGGTGDVHGIMLKVAGGNDSYHPIIPRGYGFRLERYVFNSTYGNWPVIYDSGTDGCNSLPKSDRCGKIFTKLQASATTFASRYLLPPLPGESPFCYAGCRGYGIDSNANPSYSTSCDTTPCNTTTSNFWEGENSIQLIRLTVYT